MQEIAEQAGSIKYVRDYLLFKDFGAYYNEGNSEWYRLKFYSALRERGWEVDDHASVRLTAYFKYKNHSSNANDFGII